MKMTSFQSDLLQWLIDSRPLSENPKEIVLRILASNLASVHTVSVSFLHTFHYLAAYSSYQEPLRQEIQTALKTHKGWTKAALQDMRLLDSFIKESLRLKSSGLVNMSRTVMKPWTLSNGVTLPKGIDIYVVGLVNRGPIYENPEVFDGYRFYNMRESEKNNSGRGVQHQMVATNKNFISFGHGISACPGRFFAAIELKIALATLLLDFDFRMEDDGKVPDIAYVVGASLPNTKIPVLFRRRAREPPLEI